MSKNNFTYTLQIDAEIQNVLNKTQQVKKSMESIISAGKAPGAEKLFDTVEKAIERLQTKASQPITSVAAFENLKKDASAVETALGKLGTVVSNLGNMSAADKLDLLPPNLKDKITAANGALASFAETKAKAAKKSDELVTAEKALASAQEKLRTAEGKVSDKKAQVEIQKIKVKTDREEADAINAKIVALEKYQKTNAAYEKVGADKSKAGGTTKGIEGLNLPKAHFDAWGVAQGLGIDLKDTQAVEAALASLKTRFTEANAAANASEKSYNSFNAALGKAETVATAASNNVTTLQNSVNKLNNEFEQNKARDTQSAYEQLRASAGKLGVDISNIPLEYTEQNFVELNDKMNQLVASGIAQVDAGMDNIQMEMEETNTVARNLGDGFTVAGEDVKKLDATVSNTTAFTARIAQFVGLQGGIQIARRAMRDAINTIKDLDAAMTEMAVVTDLEVGDYWEQLPRHTEDANKLGVAIKDVYEAETLYYQQGLKTNEVIAMSGQTLKMARIAGLSAEDATNKMTAALRGFNMELNETSAQRIADVYSELAAITASDVDEISTAMTKTASIASNAGMEFETTAAFLSQIIETTRESAETAGTAMKTVIARFQELKKDPAEIGEVDGEVVDANKIEGALRTVGVSLRDASGQFRELDNVFLELASKWDSLDTNTQRYIATVAAGSRQQSRFIAMMSNYSRTQELVEAANASAGASNKQFEKTMDSLDAKLNKLKNAWDSFTMGIMNSEILKAGIDLLTGIMNAINGITDAFGDFSGAAKIGLLVAALYLGDKALKVFMTSLKGGSTIFQAFGKVGKTSLDGVKQSFERLVQATKGTNAQLARLQTLQKNTVGSSVSLKTAQDKVALAERNLATAMKKYGAESEVANIATRRLKQAQTDLAFQDAAYIKISQEKQAMRYFGISSMEAEILALQGATAKEIEAAIAKEMSTGCSKREAVARVLSAYGVQEESKALTLNNLIRQNGLLGFLQELGLLLLGRKSWKELTAEENKNTRSKGMQIIATLMQAAANGTLLATMWPILLATLAIAAAVMVLIGIIYLIIKAVEAWKNSQPDAQLAALQEKTKQAKETAEETKKAYDDLLTAQDEYDGLANQLENLTEGTTEWKEAMAELNNKVLELISTYPQLLQYMKIAENGVMSIAPEGWDAVINQQAQAVGRAQAVAFRAQAEEAEFQKELNKHKTKYVVTGTKYLNSQLEEVDASEALLGGTQLRYDYHQQDVYGAKLDYDVGANNQEALESLSKLTWGTQEYQNALGDLKKTIGEANTEQLEALNTFDATQKQLYELDKIAESAQRNALASVGSLEAQNDTSYNRIIESLTESYDDINKKAEESATKAWEQGSDTDKYLWNNGTDTTGNKLKAELLKYGIVADESEKKAMAQLLAAKGGKKYTDEEIEELGKGADEKFAEELQELEEADYIAENYVNKLYQLQEENEALGDLYSGSLDIDLDVIQGQIDQIEDADGVLKKALNSRIETIKDARKDIDLELEKIYGQNLTMPKFEGYDQKNEFLRAYNEMLSEVGGGLATNFADLFSDLSPEEQKEYFANYGEIDWGSSIEGAAALKEMLQSSSIALQEFAVKTLAIESATYSATAQMNEFYKSLSPETLEDLAKDGEITATEILEMAKSNETLATMMDTTGVSAASLAHYYELLEEGTLSAHEATDGFIKALDELNAASNTIENAFGFIDTFEPSRSQTEISEYFSGMRESALELYDMGAYGDQALKDYIAAFLDEGNWQAIIDKNNGDMQAAMDEAMAQINSYGENLYGAWQTLVEKGLQGVSMAQDGSIQFDMTQIGSLDQLKQQITDMGWSEAMADALIADAQTFSIDLEDSLDELGVANMFETWLKDAFSINGKTIIPKGQVEAMADELHTTFKELKEDLEGQGISVGEWVTEDGQVGADFADLREQMIEDAQKAGKFDLDTNYQLLLELGLDDAAAKAELKTMANSLTDMPMKVSGETITQTAGVLYNSTGMAIEGASTGGLIDSLEDPKVKAAQELSAIEQGEMMAKANATGSIVASRIALQASAEGIDSLINGAIDILNYIPGVNISKSNLAGSVAKGTDNLVNSAIAQIEARNKSAKDNLNKTINSATTSGEYSSTAVTNLTDKYATDIAAMIKAYTDKNAQEAGMVQEEEGAWENPYDELYNLNQRLNTVIREREKLERSYERALENSTKTAVQLVDITNRQLTQLEKEAKLQKDIADEAIAEAKRIQQENTQYESLYSFDTTTGEVQVDWEAAERRGWSSDEGSEFEDFVSSLEELGDTFKEAQDSLADIEDQVEEIEKRGRDATSDIYNQVKEGLIQERQEEIDKLQSINEAIDKANSAIVEHLQQQIEEARQARENEKAEQEIADKETRLAYLMRDTSGGNATEIASLQKEIDENKQSHTDSLVDQAIENLQSENERAAEQRQQQIDIAQEQLEAYSNSQQIWQDVKELVGAGYAAVAGGVSFSETTAGQLAAFGEDVDTMNPFEKEDFIDALNTSAKEGAIYEGFLTVTGKGGEAKTIGELANSIRQTIEGMEMQVTSSGGASKIITTVKAYETGGLADFTGPAWLDGTKSKPEIVLNQTDSANFMQLRDILADILNGTSGISGSGRDGGQGGDNYYDIAISVDSLGSDYDVEQLANKIRSMIYEDATYRNVNSVETLR